MTDSLPPRSTKHARSPGLPGPPRAFPYARSSSQDRELRDLARRDAASMRSSYHGRRRTSAEAGYTVTRRDVQMPSGTVPYTNTPELRWREAWREAKADLDAWEREASYTERRRVEKKPASKGALKDRITDRHHPDVGEYDSRYDDLRRDQVVKHGESAYEAYRRLRKPAPLQLHSPRRAPVSMVADMMYNQALRARLFGGPNNPRSYEAALRKVLTREAPEDRADRREASFQRHFNVHRIQARFDRYLRGSLNPILELMNGVHAARARVRNDPRRHADEVFHHLKRKHRGRPKSAREAARDGWFNLGLKLYLYPKKMMHRR